MKPDTILGEAIFTSYGGLRAEGGGALAFLNKEARVIEMRDPKILNLMPAFSSSEAAIFVQMISSPNKIFWVIGIVQKIRDYTNRDGILGACIAMSSVGSIQEEHLNHLRELYARVCEKFDSSWSGKSLPSTTPLGLIPRGLEDVGSSEYNYKDLFEIIRYGSDIDEYESIDWIARRILATRNLGRVFLTPMGEGELKPLDPTYRQNVLKLEKQAQEKAYEREQERARREADRAHREAEHARFERMAQETDSDTQKEVNQKLIRYIKELDKRLKALEEKSGVKNRRNVLREPSKSLRKPARSNWKISPATQKKVAIVGFSLIMVISILFAVIGIIKSTSDYLSQESIITKNKKKQLSRESDLKSRNSSTVFASPICGQQQHQNVQDRLACEQRNAGTP